MNFNPRGFLYRRWKYALGALIILIGLGFYFFWGNGDTDSSLIVTPGDFKEQVSVSGTVIATKDVDLGFASNGRISGIYADVGQRVQAGTVIAQTENGDLIAELAQAEAKLASLQAGTRPEEINIATTAVTNAQNTLVNAIQGAYTASDDAVHNKMDVFFTNPRTDPKLSFTVGNSFLKTSVEQERAAIEIILAKWALLISGLNSDNVDSSAEQAHSYTEQVTILLADANSALNQGLPDTSTSSATLSSYISTLAVGRTNVNSAATTLSTDIAALVSAEKNLELKKAGSTIEDIAAQQADVAAARASLTKTRIVAPFTGTVTRMDAKVGEIISPTDSLISMQSDGVFQIETFIPEVSIARVAVGNPATTTLDAYGSSVNFSSVVISVDPAETVKDGVPTYKTKLSFTSSDQRIRSGMTANVIIETGVLRNAIVIPTGALGMKSTEFYVSVVNSDSISNRVVSVGISPALGQTEILSGLSAGDRILLSPKL